MITIPEERLNSYAATATAAGNVSGTITTIEQVLADITILRSERRSSAVKGADRILAGCVRRLCATAAWTEGEAAAKLDVLARVRKLNYGGSEGADVLMRAMIDAAEAFETGTWFAPVGRH